MYIYLPSLHPRRPVQPLLLDGFDGSGALSVHTPEVRPADAAWSIISGTWGSLSGGLLPYASGTNGRAVIDCAASDFEMRWKARHWAVASKASGVLVRGNAAASDYYAIGTFQYAAGQQCIEWSLPNSITLEAATQPNPNKRITGLTAGEYYTWTLILRGAAARLYDAEGVLLLASNGALKSGQTCVGPYVEQPYGSWDFIEVKPVWQKWRSFSVMGDSISDGVSEWPNLVSCRANNGRMYVYNHSLPGSTVAYQMDGYTDQCAADDADFTIVALGTNDGAYISAEYQENLQELFGTLHKPIYAMGVLPKTDSAQRDAANAAILAAVENAAAAGVNVTYWNTDGWIDPAADTSDGLHPTAAGQEKIATEVLARL